MSTAPSTTGLAERFAAELQSHPELLWRVQGLVAGSPAWVAAALLAPQDRPTLVVAPDTRTAERLCAELRIFVGEDDDTPHSARRVHLFPARETPPLEMISPSPDVESARMAALYELAFSRAPLVVTSPEAMLGRVAAPERVLEGTLSLAVGAELPLEDLCWRLEHLGYRRVGTVQEPGELAVRGGIVDLWPPGADNPCRVELFGDEIESLRHFDAVEQTSFARVDELVVLPSMAFAVDQLADPAVRRAVHMRCDDLGLPTSERKTLDACLAAGERFPGVELMAPFVGAASAWLGDYLPGDTLVAVVDPSATDAGLEAALAALAEAREAAMAAGSFFPDPASLYMDAAAVRDLLSRRPLVELDRTEALETSGEVGHRHWRLDVRANTAVTAARARVRSRRAEDGFAPMAEALAGERGTGLRLVVTASDATQQRRLEHLLGGAGLGAVHSAANFGEALAGDRKAVHVVRGHLREGFVMPGDRLLVVSDEEIFGERRAPRRRRRSATQARVMSALAQLEPGDFLVHVEHGVGRYHGLKHLVAAGMEGDFLHIEYAGGDRYYLPVDRINLVERYVGSGGAEPTLDKLGGTAWARTKKKARDSILAIARELLEVEAWRAVHTRDPWVRIGEDFEEFEARFPFEETQGQIDAIEDIKRDFTGTTPMDRVVCGDVGYGKTEVAVRAAYLAAMAGRQVAFLVPTTVLARQHYRTLCERLEGYPVEVRMLSRFQSRAENAAVAAGVADGSVDIVVGTHRMLQNDVDFARLGLLVIDEEHRFGVKAKEYVKRKRRQVDVLTLTATPIPRTLQLSLTGVRDLSLIETPPVDRLAIRTYVARYDEGLIKQAIERELGRGGQVFFVHNRVSSIEMVARRLKELVPGARVVIGHGQMEESALEDVMMAFLDHEADILVCTSIIESGLDIPNANTILVNRADTFGLAQLYQIRGRVGRSHRRAYAYLMVPGEQLITEEARKRLAVLQELDDLGSGFRLAAHDMEIRGAGNLLGKQQSGQIAAIGFELFMRMMEEATAEVRGLPAPMELEPEVELGSEAFLPDFYVPDVSERLGLYKRLATAPDALALDALADELADRFGPLPRQVANFVRIMRLRPALKELGIESLKAHATVVALRFREGSPVGADVLARLVQESPRKYRLRPGGVLAMRVDAGHGAGAGAGATGPAGEGVWEALVDEVEALLALLLGGRPKERKDEGSKTVRIRRHR